MLQDLIETTPFTYQLVENSANGKLILEGVCGKAGVQNQNRRIYTANVWNKALSRPELAESINSRRMLGCISHPASGKTDLAEASHLVSNVYLKGDDLIARLEVLPTPKGNIIKSLVESNVPIGVSLRAVGSVKDVNGTKYVNEDDYNLVAVDFVSDPSFTFAYPKPIYESTENFDNMEENSMTALDKLQLLESRSTALLGIKAKGLDSGVKVVAEKAIADLIVEATKLSTESPEVSKLASNLVESLVAKRNSLVSLNEETFGNADSGQIRVVPKEAPPPMPQSGWTFDPSFAFVESDVERMITSLVGEETEEDEDEKEKSEDEKEKSEDEKEKNKKQRFGKAKAEEEKEKEEEDKVDESKFVKLAFSALKDKAAPASVKAFAAAYLTEAKKRIRENNAFVSVIEKMQSKLDEAVKSGKIIVESDENVAQKYQLATDVLKEVVRRYHLKESLYHADKELAKVNLAEDVNARQFVAEAIKTHGATKETVNEAIAFFTNVKSKLVSPTSTTKQVNESKEIPADLPNGKKLEAQVANLNESKTDNAAADYGVTLFKRLEGSFKGSRSKK